MRRRLVKVTEPVEATVMLTQIGPMAWAEPVEVHGKRLDSHWLWTALLVAPVAAWWFARRMMR